MSVPPPDTSLRRALRRLFGDHGARAERFLVSAAKHLDDADEVAPQHVAYALREALTAILEWAGTRPRGMTDAAREVVRRFDGAGGDSAQLADAIGRLRIVLDGPGPHAERLERALSELARLPPTRATADLIERFVAALDGASVRLHAETPPTAEDARALYEATLEVLRGLFGPIPERLEAVAELARVADPGRNDVARLHGLVGDERHLVYLFDTCEGPGWFRALRDDALLVPPADRPWTAGPYVLRVAASHPDEMRTWLADRPFKQLEARQAGALLRIVRTMGGDVGEIARALAVRHLSDPDVRMQADALIRGLPAEQRESGPVRSLIQRLLTVVLTGDRGSLDLYVAGEQLALAVAAARGPEGARWLTMLAWRAQKAAAADEPLRQRLLPPLDELALTGGRRPVELVVAALREAANACAAAGAPLGERLDALRIVPNPLAERLVAQHLLDQLPSTADAARAFLVGQLGVNVWPSPEELKLLRSLLAGEDADGVFAGEIVEVLGSPPAREDLESFDAAEDVPDAVSRVHRWLVAVPADVAPEWHAADAELPLVGASPDGVLVRSGLARWSGPSSPLDRAVLEPLAPLEAARRVAAWRPAGSASFFGPSAEGLAGVLREVIDARSHAWFAEDPVDLARVLREPIYVGALIDALSAHADRLRAGDAVALAELVTSRPWPPAEDLAVDPLGPANTWARPADAAVQLLGRLGPLADLPEEDGERAWRQVAGAFARRDDRNPAVEDPEHEPLTQAINRPSMRALDVAFGLGGSVPPDARLLELVDGALDVGGSDGLQARAVLARRLHWLRRAAPEWFASRAARIFGDEAPDGLGPRTVDLYLEWGDLDREIVTEQREAIVAALGGARRDEAVQVLVLGLRDGLAGYELAAVAGALVGAGDEAVAHAGRWMGWGLAEAGEDADVAPLLALWRELLGRDLGVSALASFGCTAVNTHLPDDEWLELIEATIRATGGVLDEPDHVAERAARRPDDPRTARVIAGLLADDPRPWDLERIGTVGLAVLASAAGEDARELRERLLERGFHEAL